MIMHSGSVPSSRAQGRPPRARPTWALPLSGQLPPPSLLCTLDPATAHHKPSHPESPDRIAAIAAALHTSGLCAPGGPVRLLDSTSSNPGGTLGSTRLATDAELGLVHSPGYIHRLRELSDSLKAPSLIDDSTYIAPGSFTALAHGLGAALDLADAVMAQQLPPASGQLPAQPAPLGPEPVPSGFALIRPPGHHVLPQRPMGFGLVNTVSVLARYIQQVHRRPRILIFDFDVHHGNGTMEVFYSDPSVLYVSMHQAGLWPYTGKASNTGSGPGRGSTLNIPLPGGSGDAAMRAAFTRLLLPAARHFAADAILVSAGFDAHYLDPLAGLTFRTGTYRWLAEELRRLSVQLCGGRLLLVLEGGYHLQSLGECVVATAAGLAGLPQHAEGIDLGGVGGAREQEVEGEGEPMHKVEEVLRQVGRLHGLD